MEQEQSSPSTPIQEDGTESLKRKASEESDDQKSSKKTKTFPEAIQNRIEFDTVTAAYLLDVDGQGRLCDLDALFKKFLTDVSGVIFDGRVEIGRAIAFADQLELCKTIARQAIILPPARGGPPPHLNDKK